MDCFFRIGGLTLGVRGSDVPVTGPLARFAVDPAEPDVWITVRHDPHPPLRGTLSRHAGEGIHEPSPTAAGKGGPERSEGPGEGSLLFDSGAVWTLFADGDGYRIDCRAEIFGDAPYKSAHIARHLRAVEIRTRIAGLNPIEFPLDELLLNAILTQRGGVELHACGIIDRGEGLLFIGNSGDGKTTTAHLWQHEPADIVSDDRVIVRRHVNGWTMYGTPWHGEAEICSPAHAPLRRIYVLDKSARNGATALAPAEAAARLLSCAFPPFHDPRGLATVVDTLGALAQEVPVARLSFANDPSAVDFVRQEAAA